MFEIGAHGRKAAAMGEAIGMQTNEDRAQDGKEGEADPGQDERQKCCEVGTVVAGLAGIHPVDDAAEKYRFGKLRRSQSEIAENKEDGQSNLVAEQAQSADIEAGQGHAAGSLSKTDANAYIDATVAKKKRIDHTL
jgi:hypothetical protein